MNFEIHTLYWKNSNPVFYHYHSKIMNKFNVDINYSNENINHGIWMDKVINESKSDIIGFIDIDCVVTNDQIISECIKYLNKKKSIIGIAQVTGHIHPANHIFVGAGFFFIFKKSWEDVGKPSFVQLKDKLKNYFKTKYDYAEGVCYAFEKKKIKYKALYPTHFQKYNETNQYHLHNYGPYGIGTHFNGGIYHLYESRNNDNIQLFKKKCEEILNNKFSTSDMISCLDFSV